MFARSSLLLVALLGFGTAARVAAEGTSENAEARVYFEEGNRLYQESTEARGAEQQRLLQRSLEAYVDSLQIVRSRNALFNAAIVLDELGRYDEAFDYFSEHLRIEGLSEADREDASSRRDALRSKVAVLRVTSEPVGAQVWVDRKDLAPRGETPIELALPPGEHRTFVEKPGYEPLERTEALVRGETASTHLQLAALPVEAAIATPPLPAPEPSPRQLRLRNAAIGTAAGTLATAAAALGVSIRAKSLGDEYEQAAAQYQMSLDPGDYQRAQDLADKTDRFNLTADVLWGVTIGLAITSVTLAVVHKRKKDRQVPELGVSVSRHGGFASLRMPFGAKQ